MLRDKSYCSLCTAINKLTGADVKSSLLTFAVKDKHGEDKYKTTGRAYMYAYAETAVT